MLAHGVHLNEAELELIAERGATVVSNPVANLKLDHAYTGLHKNASAVIEYRKQALRLRISASEDFTHMVIYTLSSEAGGSFFCLENQTCSTDAINLSHRGLGKIAHLLELGSGESSSGFIRYAIG